MYPVSPTTKRLEKKQEPTNGGWGEKLWSCQMELVKDKQMMRTGQSSHLQLPSLNSVPQESLDSSICKLSWTLMCFFSFSFSCASFTEGCFCCPRRVEGSPSCSVSPPSCSPDRILAVPTWHWGLPLPYCKEIRGIRVLACNSLHRTETCAFL